MSLLVNENTWKPLEKYGCYVAKIEGDFYTIPMDTNGFMCGDTEPSLVEQPMGEFLSLSKDLFSSESDLILQWLRKKKQNSEDLADSSKSISERINYDERTQIIDGLIHTRKRELR